MLNRPLRQIRRRGNDGPEQVGPRHASGVEDFHQKSRSNYAAPACLMERGLLAEWQHGLGYLRLGQTRRRRRVMHLVAGEILEQGKTGLQEVFHVVFEGTARHVDVGTRKRVLSLRAAEKDTESTGLADKLFLTNE